MSAEHLSNLLDSLGFGPPIDVRGRGSLEGLLSDAQTCGVYLLLLADGTCYIGQSVNITQRFLQHRRSYANIEQVRILPLYQDKRLLDEREVEAIHTLERAGAALLNIVHTSVTAKSSPFDVLVPPHQQRQWLESDPLQPAAGAAEVLALVSPNLRAKTAERLTRLRQRPDCAEVLELLGRYLRACVPWPQRSEAAFWSVSCLPSSNGGARLACFNMNTMEVFVVGYTKQEPERLWGFINLSREVLRQTYPTDPEFLRRHPQAELRELAYAAAGLDQINVAVDGQAGLRQLLGDPAVLRAARLLNLHLMRKRGNLYGQFHCYALAEALLGPRAAPAPLRAEAPPAQTRPDSAPATPPALRRLERWVGGSRPAQRRRRGKE